MMATMAAPRKRKPKSPGNPWPARLRTLKNRLNRTDEAMAALLRIRYRVWVSWLYGERKPSDSGKFIIELAELGILPEPGTIPKPKQ